MRTKRRLRWAAIPFAAFLVFVLAGCTEAQLHGFLPGFVEGQPPVTGNTDRVSGLWTTAWIILLVVGVVTWSLTVWAAIAYRRRRGQTGTPPQLRYNMPIEVFYTVVPLILVLGFFAFTVRDQTVIQQRYANPDVQIEIFGKQWSWDFNYVHENVYSAGVQAQPNPNGVQGSIDQTKLPTLYLPVGKTVEIKLETRDVIHSFWVIDFLYKQDMIPGKTNYMSVIPEREGTYAGKCAELCGEYHSMMLFNVKVVSEAEYEQHIVDLQNAGFRGQLGQQFDRNTNLPGTPAPQPGQTDHFNIGE